MTAINIICVGKLKESFWREAVAEYAKRITKYASINTIELPESKLSDKPSDKEIEQALMLEAKAMEMYLNQNHTYNIAACIEGRIISSEELAKIIDNASIQGFSTVNFFIGSSFGLAKSIKERSHFKLSMSKMTFPHQLARVMLSEQIYRALSINANARYHK